MPREALFIFKLFHPQPFRSKVSSILQTYLMTEPLPCISRNWCSIEHILGNRNLSVLSHIHNYWYLKLSLVHLGNELLCLRDFGSGLASCMYCVFLIPDKWLHFDLYLVWATNPLSPGSLHVGSALLAFVYLVADPPWQKTNVSVYYNINFWFNQHPK